MHQKEINTLRLLEALSSDQSPSQREIAKRLKISLGMVNALLKRLVQKGYLEISNISESKVKYLLTPKGDLEISNLTYRYIRHSLGFYKEIQEKLRNLFKEIKIEGKQRIVLYGNGAISNIACEVMNEQSLTLVDIIDNEKDVVDLDYDIILILELEEYSSIAQSLENSGILKEKILIL